AYSLLTDGLLLLGTSESITGFDDRFITVDRKWKLFKRRPHIAARAIMTELPLAAPGTRLQPFGRSGLGRLGAGLGAVAERLLLTSFMPLCAVITERGETIYLHGRTGSFLEP